MNIRDNWKYRIRPVFSTLIDFILQVWSTIKEAAAKPLSTSVASRPVVPAVSFLVAVAVIGIIGLVVVVVGAVVLGLLIIAKII